MTERWWYEEQPLDSAVSSVLYFLLFVMIIFGLVYCVYVAFPVEEAETRREQQTVRISFDEYIKYLRHVAEQQQPKPAA